jgi:hypothetical protein
MPLRPTSRVANYERQGAVDGLDASVELDGSSMLAAANTPSATGRLKPGSCGCWGTPDLRPGGATVGRECPGPAAGAPGIWCAPARPWRPTRGSQSVCLSSTGETSHYWSDAAPRRVNERRGNWSSAGPQSTPSHGRSPRWDEGAVRPSLREAPCQATTSKGRG